MKINGVEASSQFGSIETGEPENIQKDNEETESIMDQDKLAKLLKKILEKIGSIEDRLSKLEDGTEDEEAEEKNLSEEEAVAYLLSGGDESVNDAAVDQLLAFNSKRREDG